MQVSKISNDFLEISTLSLGATLQKLIVKNSDCQTINVVAGYDDLSFYENNKGRLGNTMGRFAGRISTGRVKIENENFDLFKENDIHLHGGKEGFDKKNWRLISAEDNRIIYEFESPHLDEGYPGNLKVRAFYTLIENSLEIAYQAETDMPTIVNLTNHSYFNLNGEGTILNHELRLNCDSYLDFDENLIPTGDILTVENSPLDFRNSRKIGSDEKFKAIDNCLPLTSSNVGHLFSPQTGIEMAVETTQSAVVVYTPANFLDRPFSDGAIYNDYPAICFETQNYSDAINKSNFPNAVLSPEEMYRHKTTFTFNLK